MLLGISKKVKRVISYYEHSNDYFLCAQILKEYWNIPKGATIWIEVHDREVKDSVILRRVRAWFFLGQDEKEVYLVQGARIHLHRVMGNLDRVYVRVMYAPSEK